MTDEQRTSFDWAASRGEKWRAQLGGMEAMLAPLDAPLIDALRLDAPLRIADIGCGGGGTTLAIAQRAPLGSVVHGVDISPGLIETARGRTSRVASGLVFSVDDVAKAAPPGGPFDRLVSRFGVMFFEDPPAAFANLRGWLAPGARFAFAVWGPPAENAWVTTVRDVVSTFIELPPPAPDAPGPFRYSQIDSFSMLLARAGFTELRASTWRADLAIGGGFSAADAADFALASFSIAEPLTQADDATRAGARRILTERFLSHLQGGVVRLGACAHFVTGRA